jgi:hypothetical protein
VVVLHESVVHTVASEQSPADVQQPLMGVAWHVLLAVSQLSAVHGSLSLQFESAVQHEGIAACTHWCVVGLHVSCVQIFESSHSPSFAQQFAIAV